MSFEKKVKCYENYWKGDKSLKTNSDDTSGKNILLKASIKINHFRETEFRFNGIESDSRFSCSVVSLMFFD